MQHNLTDNQLKSLRRIVQQVKGGELEETFSYDQLDSDVNFGALRALVASGILLAYEETGAYRKSVDYTLTRTAYEIDAFDFSNPDPDPERFYIKEIHRLLQKHFNRTELDQICFDLGVNDWAFGDNPDRPFELLLYLYRQSRLKELTPIIQEQRPAVDWPEYPDD